MTTEHSACLSCGNTGWVWMDTAYARVPVITCYCMAGKAQDEKLRAHLPEIKRCGPCYYQNGKPCEGVVVAPEPKLPTLREWPCECGVVVRGSEHERGRKCSICLRAASEPTPPTLREWLGPRVSELGPWAEVLREQPVPAGMIHRFEWERQADGSWWLYAHDTAGLEHVTPLLVARYLTEQGALHARAHDLAAWNDSLQMALFTRYPAVKPEPRPAAIVCEDQYEVMP